MDDLFETRYITVVIFGNGRFRIMSDGLLDCGEKTYSDFEQSLDQLYRNGWELVGSVDHKLRNAPYQAMDLFFRRAASGDNETDLVRSLTE